MPSTLGEGGVRGEAIDKQHILREIHRTAKANGGVALGWRRFEEETGIRFHDWYGQHRARWRNAVRDAGLEPNRMSEAYDEAFLGGQLVLLTRRLGRVPTEGDLRLTKRGDPEFPSETVFRRLGSKAQRAARILAHCEANPGYDDVAALGRQVPTAEPANAVAEVEHAAAPVGFVYLLKSGAVASTRLAGRITR